MAAWITFSALDDLYQHVHELPEDDGSLRRLLQEIALPFVATASDYTVYCQRFRHGFRSEYERMFALLMVQKWKWKVSYEPIALRTGEHSLYVPDFFVVVPRLCFIEVKGEWRTGAQRKFKKALELFGKDRMLLVGNSLYREICKEASRL